MFPDPKILAPTSAILPTARTSPTRFERRAAAAALVEQMNELIGSTFLTLDGAIRIPPTGALSGDAPRSRRALASWVDQPPTTEGRLVAEVMGGRDMGDAGAPRQVAQAHACAVLDG